MAEGFDDYEYSDNTNDLDKLINIYREKSDYLDF